MLATEAIYLFSCFLITTVFGLKTWISSTDLNDKGNWNILDTPKDCDDVLFNIHNDLPLAWSMTDITLIGLTLPASGILTFQNDMFISFADEKSCPKTREIVYQRNWKSWLDPDNWISDSASSWLPHSERIPCFGENIKFPAGKNFAVQLPVIMVPFGKIIFDNEEYDGNDWADYLNTDEGKSQFRSEESQQLPWSSNIPCPERRRCSCGRSSYSFRDRLHKSVPTKVLHEAVCLVAGGRCKKPACYSPILPEGHCCGVCGTIINVKDNTEDDRMLNQLSDTVNKMKIETDGVEHLRYYVGRTLDGHIQVVILTEDSDYMNHALIFADLVKQSLIGSSQTILSSRSSGLTFSSYFSKGIFGIIGGTFMAVAFFFVSLFYIYIILPKKNIVKLSEQNRFRFAKFKNVIHEADSDENIEIDEGQEAIDEGSSGFHNPTFSSEPTASKSETEEYADESEGKTRQEYDNPTYHEMEKSKEFKRFEVNAQKEATGEENELNEIK